MNFGPKYMEEALKKRALLNKEIVEERHRWSGSEVKSVEVPAGNTDWKLCLPEGSAARSGGCVSIHPYDVSKLPPINIMQEIRTQPNFLAKSLEEAKSTTQRVQDGYESLGSYVGKNF